jgi:pimeloyl-ACP methyl ester carboxylesterase
MPSVTQPSGGNLIYREIGNGEPLILVHGSPGEGRAWWRVAERLAERYRVLMPDLPGYGGSDPLPVEALGQTAAIGAAVQVLIESCGRPVRLCGHSYGGNVALHAAVKCADRIHSLALFEPVFFRALDLAGDWPDIKALLGFFADYADRVAGFEPAAISEMIDYWFGPGAFALLPARVQGFLRDAAPKNAFDVRASLAERVTIDQLARELPPPGPARGHPRRQPRYVGQPPWGGGQPHHCR